ncbi:FecR domain-containing protein [Maridesulfovibrio ferrireducens]|uniref:FecR domain-containing protein n=1 Tax=Maridesulfovibrio ferrireducens TaxID=246191 RepID=UPI001A187ED9|nr:FecR domain-containing protein [Maridesulfovibrio ferrireducens]MBI9110821.1 FecR domain-containing protein [Maridesulfovibrio ferrireducens]
MSPTQNADLNSIGVVLAANGEVFLQSDSGMRTVQSGAPVYAGEELITGPGSTAEIRFVDDTLLSQGADSSISLDDYIYDNTDDTASELLFKMSQGTFRMVTGKIAEQNPERFKVGSPLATIGIRGTITVHEIGPDGEKHGVEEIHSGKALLIQSIDGQIRQISTPRALVDIAASGLMSTVRPMTIQEFEEFQSIAPAAIQAEQEIQEQQDQEDPDQKDQQDEGDQQQGEGEGEGGEPDADVSVMLGDVFGGEFGLEQSVDAFMLGLAQDALDALAQGDLVTAQELLQKLEDIPTDDDILELIENTGTGDIPDDGEGHTHTSDDGITWVLGTSGDDTLIGTENTDYINGLGGNDTIHGLGSNDTLYGDTGNDTIFGDHGNDYILGGAGDDTIGGDSGTNTLNGGEGLDYVSYASSSAFVTVCIDSGTAEHGDDIDYLTSFEGVIGSSYNDSFFGGTNAATFIGGNGNDFIESVNNFDVTSYEDATGGVSVNLDLSSGEAFGDGTNYSGIGIDTLRDVNNVIGSGYADSLLGNGNANTITAGAGNDTLTGLVGADLLIVGSGNNEIRYTSSGQGGDTVTNFISANDTFKFSSASYSSGAFQQVADYAETGTGATGSGAYFIYDPTNDKLFYDSDVTAGVVGELIATVDEVNASDIVLY